MARYRDGDTTIGMGTKLREPDAATLAKMLAGIPAGSGSPQMRERVVASSMRALHGATFLYVEETALRHRDNKR
ncbi:MAG: hypothetical protein JWN10_2429 [Solirubrobacterales bacterium]|nr:hypothetical protein [Solirubrobacterales bacterium]